MKQLLAKGTLRQLKFIEQLFEAEDWVPIKQTALSLECSTKALHDDILQINNQFAPFKIETSQKDGLRLFRPNNYSIDYIYRVILEASPEFRFLELIYFNETFSGHDISEHLYLSLSTFNRILSRVKIFLLPLGITIHTSPYRIDGSEMVIRNFFVHYFLEKYSDASLPFSNSQIKTIDFIIQYAAEQLNTSLDYPDIKLLRAILLVNITRIQKGHSIQVVNSPSELDTFIHEISHHDTIKQFFYKDFHIILTDSLIKELFAPFLNQDFLFHVSEGVINKPLKNKNSLDIIHNLSNFLDRLSLRLDISIDNKEKIILELFNLQHLFYGNNYILYNKKEQFSRQIEIEYPKFSTILKEELDNFQFHSKIMYNALSFNELIYTLLIHWDNLNEKLAESVIPLTIGIFCDFDFEHSLFLKKLISYHFGSHVAITILNAQTDSEAYEESKKFELVITNISDLPLLSKDVVCINSIPTSNDWQRIWEILKHKSNEQDFISLKLLSQRNL